jgi:hypothetical protein
MADGFIVRKGGAVTEQALAPTITEVSVTDTSITFTITNNDASTAVILYEVGDVTPDENSIELAAAATSSNITITGLDGDTEYTVSATASVTGKVLSNVTSLAIETDELIYTAATGGTTEEYDDGGKRYKSHTFTSNGTFEVTTVGDATGDRNKVDYLIVAGGGGGGYEYGGGGGAGGYLSTIAPTPNNVTPNSKEIVTVTSFSVQVGSGGTGAQSAGATAVKGTDSYIDFSTRVTSEGGGGGGSWSTSTGRNGNNGGSGGGGSPGSSTDTSTTGGTGVSGQGFAGGNGYQSSLYLKGAGGGGAGAVGQSPTQNNTLDANQGQGGAGLNNILRTGSNETRAGGGGAYSTDFQQVGGSGGGGNGSWINSSNQRQTGSAGTVNTGGGGGAGNDGGSNGTKGFSGGSGIVVIRYEIAPTV